MSEPVGDSRTHNRLMNEYGGGLALWPDDIDLDVEERGLSEPLRADLLAFSDRWNVTIDPEVADDRWDGVPVMQTLVSWRYSLGRLLHPARQRAASEESEAMWRIREELRGRLAEELGLDYRVTYHHA